jgi:hypothetical protein
MRPAISSRNATQNPDNEQIHEIAIDHQARFRLNRRFNRRSSLPDDLLYKNEENMSIKRTVMTGLTATAVLISSLAMVAALTLTASAQETKAVKTFSAWTLYSHNGPPGDICFITSQPRETKPADVKRDRAYFYISSWVKDGIRSQVSVLLGYDLDDKSDISITIGNQDFKLFVKDDKGFVGDSTNELKLIDAMKRGNFMTVTAKTKDGVETTDTYSLIGATAAVNSLTSGCS